LQAPPAALLIMKIISVNVSDGKTVRWKGRTVETGIFKTAVNRRLAVGKLNLEGDRQSDLRVHGGTDKAVYSYDWEDYFWWNQALGRELEPGAFGENLTTEGVLDREIFVGDTLRMGTAILQAVQPRLPCYKLGLKFEDERMTSRFMEAERWGIYYRVLEEGSVQAADEIEILSRDPNHIKISDLPRMLAGELIDEDQIRRALAVQVMPEGWRNKVLQLAKSQGIPV